MTQSKKPPKEQFPELVFALVGPVGTDHDLIEQELTDALKSVGYETIPIHLSHLLRQIYPDLPQHCPEDERYHKYMEAGSKLRERTGNGDALVRLGIADIREHRKEKTGNEKTPAFKHAYVLRSLKHPDEVRLLRGIYQQGFFLISAYAPEDERLKRLATNISASHEDPDFDKWRPAAMEILNTDAEEEGRPLGQKTRNTFHMADLFINVAARKETKEDIHRFIEIIFGHPFRTPAPAEHAMYAARAIALRSGDLSRQVGAVIVDERSHVLAAGCNEVPRFGGGAYWSTDPDDSRDYILGYDPSTKTKDFIFRQVIARLKTEHWLNPEIAQLDINELTEKAIESLTDGLQLFDVLEFGRIVHAEMAAICDAAMRGISVRGATLYCTVFPCHICARHIIAAGISRVIYVEPYAKSRVKDLYPDSVTIDVNEDGKKVLFSPFTGIAPTRYAELFKMVTRKLRSGEVVKWAPATAVPRIQRFELSYLEFEEKALKELQEKLAEPDPTDVVPGLEMFQGPRPGGNG